MIKTVVIETMGAKGNSALVIQWGMQTLLQAINIGEYVGVRPTADQINNQVGRAADLAKRLWETAGEMALPDDEVGALDKYGRMVIDESYRLLHVREKQ